MDPNETNDEFSPDSPRYKESGEIMPYDTPGKYTIEDSDMIDTELMQIFQVEEEVTPKITIQIDDSFIIIFSNKDKSDELQDILCTVTSYDVDSAKYIIQDENENQYYLFYDQDENLELSSDNEIFTIVDIDKIQSIDAIDDFTIEQLQDTEIDIINEMYPSIELEMDERQMKIYSYQEKKDDLVNELMKLFKSQKDKLQIHNISEIIEDFDGLIRITKYSHKDFSDILPFIKDIIHSNKFQLPLWILPLVDNKKKLYKEEEEDQTEYGDTFNKVFEEELIEKKDIHLQIQDHYKNRTIKKQRFRPFSNKTTETIPHDGLYLRSCNPCNGLNGDIENDIHKTMKEYKLPTTVDRKTIFETLISREQLSLVGLYLLPSMFSGITGSMNLTNISLSSRIHSMNKQLNKQLRKIISDEQIIPHILRDELPLELEETEWNNKNIHSFMFPDVYDIDEIGTILSKHLPTVTDIINSYPGEIMSEVRNYHDMQQLLSLYNISTDTISQEIKETLHKKIKKNINQYIKDYNKRVTRKIFTKLPIKKNVLTEREKMKLVYDYIFSIVDIPFKNSLLRRYIQKFTREPLLTENQNYLYTKNGDEKELCKHYHYSSNIYVEQENFDLLKSIYGGEPKNGCIYCKNCGEFLCHEEFSIFEGFSEGGSKIVTSREVLDTSNELDKYTHVQQRIKKIIESISSMFGIPLHQIDIQIIIDYFTGFDHSGFLDYRTRTNQSMNKHPRMKDTDFIEYIETCNYFIIITYLVLFSYQTSPISYPSPKSLTLFTNLNVVEWNTRKRDISSFISIDTINQTMKKITSTINVSPTDDNLWKHIQYFMKEESTIDIFPPFKEQFYKLSSYIMKHSDLKKQIQKYISVLLKEEKLFIKETWDSFKPSLNNKTLALINSNLPVSDSILLKERGEYSYENIHSVHSLKTLDKTPIYKIFNVPYSEIMKNESFKRLFTYISHLYGTKEKEPTLNLLINQFIKTSSYSGEIINILERAGWDNNRKQLNNVDYSKLKQIFIIETMNLYKNKNVEEKIPIDMFAHIHMNNWNGILLNGNPKRNYNNVKPIGCKESLFFMEGDYETLIEANEIVINKIFSKYCYTENNTLQPREDYNLLLHKLFMHEPDDFKSPLFSDIEEKTKDEYETIVLMKKQSHSYERQTHEEIDTSQFIDKRLHDFVIENRFLEITGDETFPIFKKINDIYLSRETMDKEQFSNEYDSIFNMILGYIDKSVESIQDFYIDCNDLNLLETFQKRRFQSLFGKSLKSIKKVMLDKNGLLEGSDYLWKSVKSYHKIISRLSTNNYSPGTIFHSDIPEKWKLSETNDTYFKKFLSENEFLLHNDMFSPFSTTTYQGYNKYKTEDSYHLYFLGLRNYLQRYSMNGIELIIGSDNHSLTKQYSKIFHKFIFVLFQMKIIDYINDLKDNASQSSVEANLLYSSLEESERLTQQETIKLLCQFSLDMFIDTFEEFIDPFWIFQADSFSDFLTGQKEREKQVLVESLGQKTDDARLVSVQLQQCGLTNWFQGAEEEHLQHIQSETYKDKLDNERVKTVKEIYHQNQSEGINIEGSEQVLIPEQLPIPEINEEQEEQEGSYDYHEDRDESEGVDDDDY